VDLFQHAFIALFLDHGKEFIGFINAGFKVDNGVNHRFEARTLLAQFLGMLGIVPDIGVFQFATDLGQLLLLCFKVKDTP
jgi:hypothetical protein